MAHNGAKAGFITTPVAQSSSIRVCRFIFLAMLVCLVAVSYYCWTTTVNNSMLRDRVDRLSRDFSLTRNQHFAAEKNLAECKTRLTETQEKSNKDYEQLHQAKDEITELRYKQETDKSASSACEQKLKLLTQQNSEDMKAITHEVKDCKTKLDNFRDDCVRYRRMKQLRLLRAVYELTDSSVLQQLKHKFDIDITGVVTGVSPLPIQSGQQQMRGPSRSWSRLFRHKSPVVQLGEQQQNRTPAEQALTSQRQSLRQSLDGKVDKRGGKQAGVQSGLATAGIESRFARVGVRGDRGDAVVEKLTTQSFEVQSLNETVHKTQLQKQPSDKPSGNRMETGAVESRDAETGADAADADVERSEKKNTEKKRNQLVDESQTTAADGGVADSTARSQAGDKQAVNESKLQARATQGPGETDHDNNQEQDDDDDEYQVDKDHALTQ